MEDPWERGTKAYINGLGYLTKTFFLKKKNLKNQNAYDFETLHESSRNGDLLRFPLREASLGTYEWSGSHNKDGRHDLK